MTASRCFEMTEPPRSEPTAVAMPKVTLLVQHYDKDGNLKHEETVEIEGEGE